jgi:hypothetical protein
LCISPGYSRLTAAGADSLPGTRLAVTLSGMHARLQGMTAAGQLAVQPAPRAEAPLPADDPSGARLMAGLRLGCPGELPAAVAEEAAAGAGVLARMRCTRPGNRPWQEYHQRFLERYGTGAVVPLGELTDPVAGLGFQAHFHETAGQDIGLAVGGAGDRMRFTPHTELCADVLRGELPGSSRPGWRKRSTLRIVSYVGALGMAV